jgi:GNAT superfamily N-acetyltransferase
MEIREATAADAELIHGFILELAEYEKATTSVVTTVEEITSTMFGENARVKALICSIGSDPVGYAVYFYNYSTWLGKHGIYLEDVYVSPHHRGKGAGKALLKYIAKIAVQENCGRFEWSVLDWNRPSIEFYESLGAQAQREWLSYRLSGSALRKLAAD